MFSHVVEQLEAEILSLKAAAGKKRATGSPAKLREEMNRLNLLFQKGRISETYYDEQYLLLEKKLAEIPKETAPPDYKRLQNTFSGNWKELYESFDNEHKQAFWKSNIRSIQIDEETRKIAGFKFLV